MREGAKICGWLVCVFLLSITFHAQAIESRVRAVLERQGDAWIGQQIVLRFDILSNGLRFSGQRIRLPDIPGVLVLEDSVTTLNTTEKVDGKSWQVLSYYYPMFPQRAGSITIAPISVDFAVSAEYGSEPVNFHMQTGALSFRVRTPPGAGDPANMVTSTGFTLKVDVEPALDGLKVGDALTRTITRTAPSFSGMAFPPLPNPVIPGVASYPKPPRITDRSHRGELTGSRVESTIYVLQQSGALTIPGFELQWWDPVAARLHTETVPELNLEVAANLGLLPQAGPLEQVLRVARQRPWGLLAGSTALILLVSLGLRRLPAGYRRLECWRKKRQHSEPARFKQLLRACRRRRPAQAYNAYVAWVAGEGGPAADALWQGGLGSELERLQLALVGQQDSGWSSAGFMRELRRVRRAVRKQRRGNARQALPALNP